MQEDLIKPTDWPVWKIKNQKLKGKTTKKNVKIESLITLIRRICLPSVRLLRQAQDRYAPFDKLRAGRAGRAGSGHKEHGGLNVLREEGL